MFATSCARPTASRLAPIGSTTTPKHPGTTLAPPQLLLGLAEASGLRAKVGAMFGGERINETEDRAVLHVATRARRDQAWGGGGFGGGQAGLRAVCADCPCASVPALWFCVYRALHL